MSFELKAEESCRKNLRRIVSKQIDKALDELTPTHKGSRDEAVHEARKSFKKIRAMLRLVRPAIGDRAYRQENTCFRDAGRPLTEVRDAKILIETLDGLVEHFQEHVAGRTFQDIRQASQENLRAVRKRVLDEQNAFTGVGEAIRQARERIKEWADMPNKWSSMGDGLGDTYGRACAAFTAAAAAPTIGKLHEWRKQAKYLHYQLEILRPLWAERMEELASEADRMGQLLGDDHDLAVLRQMLTNDWQRIADENSWEVLLALIDRRRDELEQEAMLLGERFFQDRPRRFARRLRRYWKSWRSQAKSKQGGGLPSIPA